ncbi:MAG: hypothetical protein GY950_12105 [bacterium]|nr:hypothetical protein [bacterium]
MTIIISALTYPGSAEESFAKGEIIDKVVCKNDPSQSYSLYLPGNYSGDRKWPILYAFEPGARSRIPMGLFKPAAEKYGYIVVCSNQARNGPDAPIRRAIWAVWQDTQARFALDSRRVYATGFSGGARMSSLLHVLTGKTCAGIIACGAGLSQAIKVLKDIEPSDWYGIVGLADFNYYELMDLDTRFDDVKVTHWVEVLEMPHRWPPEADCTRALEWLEIRAMKRDLRKKDDALARSLYQQALSHAHNLEQAEKTYYAAAGYEKAQKLYTGLLDVSHAENKVTQLKSTGEYKKFQKDEEVRRRKSFDFFRKSAQILRFIVSAPKARIRLTKILKDLEIDALVKKSTQTKDIYSAGMALRLLADINIKAGRQGGQFYARKEYGRAVVFYEIAVRANKRNVFNLYNLACSYSLNKQKKKALKNLESAVKAGYRDRAHMEKDTDLDFIRDEKAFKKIMDGIR